ncbi:MAG TPA: hypothetical protein VMK84_07200 [Streptosporangiaceae bacterium]|nr:hypothetical protein [Streptosporangiaceae bacterium]
MAVNAGRDTGRAAGGFGSLYRHGFARVAVAIPRVTVADPASNAGQIIALARTGGPARDHGPELVTYGPYRLARSWHCLEGRR